MQLALSLQYHSHKETVDVMPDLCWLQITLALTKSHHAINALPKNIMILFACQMQLQNIEDATDGT